MVFERPFILIAFVALLFHAGFAESFFLNEKSCRETLDKDKPQPAILPFSTPPFLVDVSSVLPSLAQADNPLTSPPYYLNPETIRQLGRVQEMLSKDGIKLTLLSGYTPYPKPLTYKTAFEGCMSDEEYEQTGRALHRGAKVSVTISYVSGQPMGLPSFPFAPKNTPINPSCNACHNIYLLHRAMQRHGFDSVGDGWWSFEDKNWRLYPILNIDL